MREVYGAEHLLRMLVTLPQIVAFSSMDKDSVDILGVYVDELMRCERLAFVCLCLYVLKMDAGQCRPYLSS